MTSRRLPCLISALLFASGASAQTGDASVRALGAPPVHRSGQAGSSPLVLHASGDLVVAAEGVLRASPEGETRWHHRDPTVVDVGTTPDGAIYGLALAQPDRRAGRVTLTRHRPDGSVEWRHTFRERHDPFSIPQVEGAPDGGVLVCRAKASRSRVVPVLDKLDARGRVVWSRTLASAGQCHALDADGPWIAWAGARATGGTWSAQVERLEAASGRVSWASTFESYPLVAEIALDPDGAVTVLGEFADRVDLLPGPRTQLAEGHGYTTFVTRFDAKGDADWAWGSDRSEQGAALLRRGTETILIGNGYATHFDAEGNVVQRETFGYPVRDGLRSIPFLSVSAATLDARGAVVIVGGLPEPEAIAFASYYLWSSEPYDGPRGAVLMRPGW